MSIPEKLITATENVHKVFESGKNSMVDESKLLPTTVSGNYISVDDVSEVPHSVTCKVSGVDDLTSIKVTRCGRNLCGGEAFAEKLFNSGATSTIDRENKTVTLSGDRNGQNFVLLSNPKPNTQYSVFLKGTNTNNGFANVTNIAFRYSDGSHENVKFNLDGSPNICVSNANKELVKISGGWNAGVAVFEYDYFGLFEGVLSLEDFEAYNGQTLTPNTDGTVEGMTNVSPYMNVFSDTADVNIEATYNQSWGMQEERMRFYNDFKNGKIRSSISFEWLTLDQARITDIVNALSDDAQEQTLTLKKSSKEAAFIETEWQTLVSTKPNWYIALV